jgi:hypothetical protein
MIFKSLCLSGGGVNGFIHIGVLDHLVRKNHLELLDTIVGTSIGALIGFLYFLKFSPEELFDIFTKIETSQCFNLEYIDKLIYKYGIDSGEYYIAKIIDIIVEKGESPLITFQELYNKYKKRLIICGTNVSKHSPVYFSCNTFPNMKIIDAIRITTCIPFLFSPVEYKHELYVDGFLTDNYPIAYTINDYKINHCVSDKDMVQNNILGVFIHNSNEPLKNDTFENYIYNLFGCVKRKTGNQECTVFITPSILPTNFSITMEQKKELHQSGIDSVKKYLGKSKTLTKRRSI